MSVEMTALLHKEYSDQIEFLKYYNWLNQDWMNDEKDTYRACPCPTADIVLVGVVFAVTGTTDLEFRRKGLLENSPVLRLLQIGTIPSKVFGQFTFALIKELLMAKTKFQVPSMTIQGENVVGMIYASGSAHVNVNQKVIHQATPEMEKLFKRVHKKIKTRSVDPKVAKEKLENQVKKIETEAAKGETADKTKLERWLKTLAKMAPDIVEVMAASLAGPVAGFTVVFKKIVERAKATSVAS